MAGAMTRISYTTDEASVLAILVPAWQTPITGDVALATGAGAPRGFKRRVRFMRGTPSGRAHKITFGTITAAGWTAACGTAVTPVPVVPGSADTAYSWQGRTGEVTHRRG